MWSNHDVIEESVWVMSFINLQRMFSHVSLFVWWLQQDYSLMTELISMIFSRGMGQEPKNPLNFSMNPDIHAKFYFILFCLYMFLQYKMYCNCKGKPFIDGCNPTSWEEQGYGCKHRLLWEGTPGVNGWSLCHSSSVMKGIKGESRARDMDTQW